MPVFLSHKKEDRIKTLQIASYLGSKKVLCYVDIFDPELQTTDDITKKLIEKIGQCTHLMAVVSEHTQISWWVPFEIGVGTEKDRRITSYQLEEVEFPYFLKKWPILKTQADLDKFISFYKQDDLVPINESYSVESYDSLIPKSVSAEEFHRNLKAELHKDIL